MAEEDKSTSFDDSIESAEALGGNPNRNGAQDAKEVEEKGTETAEGKAEVEEPAEEVQIEEIAGEAKSEVKEDKEEKAGTEVVEEKAEEKAEAEVPTEEEAAGQGEPAEKEAEAEEGTEEKESGEEKTLVESAVAEDENVVAAKEDEQKGVEEGEVITQEGDDVVEDGGEEAGLISSEELSGETEEGFAGEGWITWEKGLLNKLSKHLNKKWIISGAAVFILIVGLVVFLIIPKIHFTDTGGMKSLEEIAGPVCDMKFFLPLAVDSDKTRFVKVTIAIELMDEGYKKEIDKKVSELRKEVINLVLTKSPKEVKSARGKEVLRKEITNKLNNYLTRECIKNTYFTEIVVL